ncbi:Fic family protein [Vagococcus acidifermentans]|uniref:Fido domain-containing protein n=1 Tax=Vagococcus acidifermentans TaxID=564710 RepID=A0A430APG0_9ENTE|nr:Fic family protein [Vagococcus acidifermentans]RSU09955.1 hypothetical protein CBF27_11705 [Vagococcus acidifermentans]
MDFTYVTTLKNNLTKFKPLTDIEAAVLRHNERLNEIYNSNALEGNTITLNETRLILDDGITIAGKSMREHLEIVNLLEAIEYAEDIVKRKQCLTETVIKELHSLVYNKLGADTRDRGNYRRLPVEIVGSQHQPTLPQQIPYEMAKLIKWSQKEKEILHPVEYAAALHEKFAAIHPFIDGNGRTGRLLLNFALTEAGYPSVIVKADNESRLIYNNTLETAHVTGDLEPFTRYINELVENKLERMIDLLEKANAYDHIER